VRCTIAIVDVAFLDVGSAWQKGITCATGRKVDPPRCRSSLSSAAVITEPCMKRVQFRLELENRKPKEFLHDAIKCIRLGSEEEAAMGPETRRVIEP